MRACSEQPYREGQGTEADVRYSPEEAGSKSASEPGTLAVVYVNDYRYISPGARYGLGIMTGNVYIESKATFSDLESVVALGVQHLIKHLARHFFSDDGQTGPGHLQGARCAGQISGVNRTSVCERIKSRRKFPLYRG